MKYMHKETGSVDTKGGWIASYATKELAERGLTAGAAFDEDEGVVLFRVRKPRTAAEKETWGSWMEYDK